MLGPFICIDTGGSEGETGGLRCWVVGRGLNRRCAASGDVVVAAGAISLGVRTRAKTS